MLPVDSRRVAKRLKSRISRSRARFSLLIRCPFSGRERGRKTLFPLFGNGSALRGTLVFSQEFTTKVVVLLGVSRKDGFGGDDMVSYSMFCFVFHGFK